MVGGGGGHLLGTMTFEILYLTHKTSVCKFCNEIEGSKFTMCSLAESRNIVAFLSAGCSRLHVLYIAIF